MPEVQNAVSNEAVRQAPLAAARESTASGRVALVQRFSLFNNVTPAQCAEIASAARERQFLRRETIFLQGDPIRHTVLLTAGSAKVMHFGQNGAEVILRLAGPGEVVGVLGSPAHSNHCSMAQALRASTALVWDASTFEALAERFPVLRRNIMKIVSQRLQELEERYREISTEKVATRLSHQLLRLFNQVGHRVNGNGTLEIHLTREDLAQLTGTTLFTVSRLLSKWDESGVVSAGRESVSVHNLQALREVAEATSE